MAFSLSPSVDVVEFDLSLTIPNLPSSKTGMVLRADYGPANVIVPLTSENDLVTKFNKPSNSNYEDWYTAWNFLQYASSLYVVRPMADSVTQPGVGLTGGDATSAITPSLIEQDFLFNEDQAEITLGALAAPLKLSIYNRYATSVQDLAVAVCSTAACWDQPIARPKFAFQVNAEVDLATLALPGGDDDLLKIVWAETEDTYHVITAQAANVLTASENFDAYTGDYALLNVEATFDNSIQVGGVIVSMNELFEYDPDWDKGEFALVVFQLDDDGKYSQVANEEYILSWNETGRDVYGRNIFVDEKLFNASKVIYAKSDPTDTALVDTCGSQLITIDEVTVASVYPEDGAGGYDGFGYTQGDVQAAELFFSSAEDFDVNLLIAHPLDINGMSTIAETRKDALAIVPLYDYASYVNLSASDATAEVVQNYGTGLGGGQVFNAFGSYSAVFGNYKYQYDKFNDVNRWMPVGGDIAGLMAVTDSTRDPWWAAAGLERGKIKNAIKLAYNARKIHRDQLYVDAINPIVNISGEGTAIVWGQKTSTAKPSAFDRINVRRLLITLEKAIASAARYSLFEFNDEFTRNRLVGLIEPFMRDVRGRRGVYDFLVVCDESNNTGEVIDRNELVIDVYLKPTRVAEFIRVNMRVTRTDADFTELIGAAAA